MNEFTAKIISIVTLGLGSLVAGLLPAAFTKSKLRRYSLSQTILLCFGAGILLATALVHILPEVSDAEHGLDERLSIIVFCSGFLLIYFIDEVLHFFCGEVIQHHHPPPANHWERTIILDKSKDVSKQSSSSCDAENNVQSSCCKEQREREIEHEIVNEGICHTAHKERCRDSITGIIGMLTALFVHSILEGLAIGVQPNVQDVWILFTAVISHKLVVAFCLGVELTASHGSRLRNHFLAILVFALGSVFGIILGIILCDFKSITESKALPVLQALAGGTLLNVTLCEVMPREKARWHQKEGNKSAGLFQFAAFAFGFSIMTVLTFYLGHEHSHDGHSHDHNDDHDL